MPGSVETSFGGSSGRKEGVASWKVDAGDVAQMVMYLLQIQPKAMISRIEMLPSKPLRK